MSEPRAYYFGCLGGYGHFFHDAGRFRSTLEPRDFAPSIPWTLGNMDGQLLKNGQRPDVCDGKVFWTCGGRSDPWFAFYWWDRSVDHRSASNSGFYVRGFPLPFLALAVEERTARTAAAFDFACKAWPQVVSRQVHPLVLQP